MRRTSSGYRPPGRPACISLRWPSPFVRSWPVHQISQAPEGQQTFAYVKNSSLLGRDVRKSGIDHPAALVVQDVGSDLAEHFWVGVAVQKVVLDLEVLSHGY